MVKLPSVLQNVPSFLQNQWQNDIIGPQNELDRLTKILNKRLKETQDAADEHHKTMREYVDLHQKYHDTLVAADGIIKWAKIYDNLSKGRKKTGFEKVKKKDLDNEIRKEKGAIEEDQKKSRVPLVSRMLPKRNTVTKEDYEKKRDLFKRQIPDFKEGLEEIMDDIKKKKKELKKTLDVWDANFDKWDKLDRQGKNMDQSIQRRYEKFVKAYNEFFSSESQSGRSRGSSGRSRGSSSRTESDYAFE